jgi:dihydroorotate dehydrogenase
MGLAAAVLHALRPEVAHRAAIAGLRLYPFRGRPEFDTRLRMEVFGLSFPNPLGLAAGFDKSGEAFEALGALGLGFVEVGTLTPRPQAGNPKPRLFRLGADRAIVNRMGFNNDGYAAGLARLDKRRRGGIVGVNVGPNKDSPDRIGDYVRGVETFAPCADYFTINISSPNTPGLRDLHARDEFADLLDRVLAARDRASPHRPVLVKISPDITAAQLDDVHDLSLDRRIDGLIVSNTSIGRPPSLQSPQARETGGLSGRPIFELSTRLLARTFLRCGGALPIIGVGGVEDAASALVKFEAGASLVQVYTGFIYRGPALIGEILRGLGAEVERRGAPSLGALVGSRAREIAEGAALVTSW